MPPNSIVLRNVCHSLLNDSTFIRRDWFSTQCGWARYLYVLIKKLFIKPVISTNNVWNKTD